MTEVKCSISNCAYWKQGNNCSADLIMIDSDSHSQAKFDAEFAGESFDTEHQDHVSKTSETCCHTFKPKSS